MLRVIVALTIGALAASPGNAQPSDPRVDGVFAAWDKPTTPGCALGIVRNGILDYAHGYGMANLELNVPITPETVFDIGSVSKQFTAMSIILLAQDGKLSLDDDIHKFIPELPAYGVPITVRTMLHHLSGLRSYTDLFDLASVPEIDETTDDDALTLIARQKTLNFPPGRQYLYSDTNYFLLALVVRRLSGETLREFARRRIFGPLGMTSTHFHDDHRMIVPKRATGYAPRDGGGFEILMSNFEELGDGSVMTSVMDMVRWDRNFDHPLVGGITGIAQLQDLGIRSDGSKTPYAMGLILDHYRGIPRVQHTGEWVGYRSSFIRFPEEKLSIIALCNMVGRLDPLGLSEGVADIYLNAMKSGTAQATSPVPASPVPSSAELASYAGSYWNAETFTYLRFEASPGSLAVEELGDDPLQLRYLGHGVFQGQNSATRYTFGRTSGEATVELQDDDSDPVVLKRVTQYGTQRPDYSQYAGTYYNDELGSSWILAIRDGRIYRKQWMFPEQALEPVMDDVFAGDLSEGTYALRFSRDAAGQVTGFEVGTTMVRPVRFSRCIPAPPRVGALAMGCKTIQARP
jgi:CubicO group peptidase (beta-lactamase class C family)